MDSTAQDGASIAPAPPHSKDAPRVPEVVADLLQRIPKRGWGKGGAPVHSAANKFAEYLNRPLEDAPIYLMQTELDSFTDWMKVRQFARHTVNAYRNSLRFLLRVAAEAGWMPPSAVLLPTWAEVLAETSDRAIKSIIWYASGIGKEPSQFSEDDLTDWQRKRVAQGRTLSAAKTNVSNFRTLIAQPRFAHLTPLVQTQAKSYGTSLADMHEDLRDEVRTLLSFLTDDLEFERAGDPLRPASAESLQRTFERLTGFVQNVSGRAPVMSIADLVTKVNVAAYLKWGFQERGLQGETLFRMFSGVLAAFRKHPQYKTLPLIAWLPAALKKLPRAERSAIDRRKERKYISFEIADAIPGMIRASRDHARDLSPVERAVSLRDELIMRWLTILPMRQRNLRECRLFGGSHKNIFCEPIRKLSSASQAKWVAEREKQTPGQSFWQIFFTKKETKSKNEVEAYLNEEIVPVLNEYLESRSALIPNGGSDPGLLFLNTEGGQLESGTFRAIVEQLTMQYAGIAVNPHLFRDVVAYEWLREHPEDFLTVSKLLWHKSLEYTLSVYGSRFNESTGIARMDDWRSKRK